MLKDIENQFWVITMNWSTLWIDYSILCLALVKWLLITGKRFLVIGALRLPANGQPSTYPWAVVF